MMLKKQLYVAVAPSLKADGGEAQRANLINGLTASGR